MTDLIEKVALAQSDYAAKNLGAGRDELNRVTITTVLREMMEPTEEMVCYAEQADNEAARKNLEEGGPGRGEYIEVLYAVMVRTFAQHHNIDLDLGEGE